MPDSPVIYDSSTKKLDVALKIMPSHGICIPSFKIIISLTYNSDSCISTFYYPLLHETIFISFIVFFNKKNYISLL